jgi:integrase
LAKAIHHVTKPADLDTHADAWVSQYLREQIEQGKSAYTLQTMRSALRLCFGPHVATSVKMPRRRRRDITRSRVPVKQDAHFQPKNWPEHILFAEATGLRRGEMRDVRVGDITQKSDGTVFVHVNNGKGGKARDVVVLSGYEHRLLAMIEGRDPGEHLFTRMPKNMDIQSYRRASAQERYQLLAPGRELPPADTERIKPTDYDATAVQEVSESLGHSRRRRATILNH